MLARPTLPSLLWTALDGLEQAYIDEGAGTGQMPSLDLWANLLRALNETGTDLQELPGILRLSKRAVRSRVSAAARNGWAEELQGGRERATVRLTVHGSEVAARWRSLQGAAEERWRAKTGIETAGKLRAALENAVGKMPLEHPHYPASYGAADASITGGNGQDWRAVRRKAGDTVSHLALSALISQALVAFAISYENRSPVALSLSAAVIKRLPADGRPLRGLRYSIGLAALARHGFVRISGKRGSEIASLTPKGVAVSEAYDERIEAVESEWRKAFGDKPVAALRQALAVVANMAHR